MERRGATHNALADAEALERGAAAAAQQLAKTAMRQRPQSAQPSRSSFSSSSAYATPQPPHSARASSAAPRPSSAAATASRGGGSGVSAENAGANNNGCGGASAEVQLAALQAALKRNMRKVIDLFREWDENGDGQISKKEVCAAAKFGSA